MFYYVRGQIADVFSVYGSTAGSGEGGGGCSGPGVLLRLVQHTKKIHGFDSSLEGMYHLSLNLSSLDHIVIIDFNF